MGLTELKSRAYDHITQSITVQTVACEIFGTFSVNFFCRRPLDFIIHSLFTQRQFAEIQTFERQFMLQHWTEVRSSSAMKDVFAAIGTSAGEGQFPAFAEVLFEVLGHLEVTPDHMTRADV